MTDRECVAFLKWAAPHLGLRWSGFRRVRGQVRKRLTRRLASLGVRDLAAYRDRLAAGDPGEWRELEAMCRISVSRFWRDRTVFERLAEEILPPLAREAAEEDRPLACWSAGCASGEEPYSLALIWDRLLAPATPGLALRVLATDVDPRMLERARRARYPASSLVELPPAWSEECFAREGDEACLSPRLRAVVELHRADIQRDALPAERFDVVLCRNLAFTHFDEAGQAAVLTRLLERLRPGGALVIGHKERLPERRGLVPLGQGIHRAAREPY